MWRWQQIEFFLGNFFVQTKSTTVVCRSSRDEHSKGWVEGRKKNNEMTTQGARKKRSIPGKINMEPENTLLEKDSLPSNPPFSGSMSGMYPPFYCIGCFINIHSHHGTTLQPLVGFHSPTQRIHVWYIYLHENHKTIQLNVGKYGLHDINQPNCFFVTTLTSATFPPSRLPNKESTCQLLQPGKLTAGTPQPMAVNVDSCFVFQLLPFLGSSRSCLRRCKGGVLEIFEIPKD